MEAKRPTETQRQILEHADNAQKINWFPENLKGGARKKVIDAMLKADLIEPVEDGYAIIVATPSKTRQTAIKADSKQAQVVTLLERAEGATIAQIMAATGWQSHTVRGCLAGSLKAKLGDTAITSEKLPGADRVYRIEKAEK